MGLLVPSLVLSSIVNCVTGAKGLVFALRYRRNKDYDSHDLLLTVTLAFINILLLVFSILQVEIANTILLSLGSGALVLYQCKCASMFATTLFPFEKLHRICNYHKYLEHLPETSILVAVIAVSLLSTLLPYKLEEAQTSCHLAGLLFFAVVYLLLLAVYGYGHHGYIQIPNAQKHPVPVILKFNILLSFLTLSSAVPSAVFYARGDIDFEQSLWINYTVAELYLLGWVLLQCTAFWQNQESIIPDSV